MKPGSVQRTPAASACQGSIGADSGDESDPTAPKPLTSSVTSFHCEAAATSTTPTPLRRLSELQYKNTLVELFMGLGSLDPLGAASKGLSGFPPDDVGTAFRGMDA